MELDLEQLQLKLKDKCVECTVYESRLKRLEKENERLMAAFVEFKVEKTIVEEKYESVKEDIYSARKSDNEQQNPLTNVKLHEKNEEFVHMLKQEIIHYEKTNQDLSDSMQRMTLENEELMKQLEDANAEFGESRVTAIFNTARDSHHKTSSMCRNESENENVHSNMNALKHQITNPEGTKIEVIEEIAALKQQLATVLKYNEKLQADNNMLINIQVIDSEHVLHRTTDQNNGDNVHLNHQDIELFSSDVQELEIDNNDVKHNLYLSQTKPACSFGKTYSGEEELSLLDSKIESVQRKEVFTDISTTHNIDAQEQAYNKLDMSCENDQLCDTIEEQCSAKHDSQENIYDADKNEIDKLKRCINEQQTDYENLENVYDELKENADEFQSELEESGKVLCEVEILRQDIEEQTNSLNIANKKFDEYTNKICELKLKLDDTLREKESKLNGLLLNELKNNVTEMEQEMKGKHYAIVHLKDELRGLRSEISEKQVAFQWCIADLGETLATNKKDHEEQEKHYHEKISHFEIENEKLLQDVDCLKKSNDALKINFEKKFEIGDAALNEVHMKYHVLEQDLIQKVSLIEGMHYEYSGLKQDNESQEQTIHQLKCDIESLNSMNVASEVKHGNKPKENENTHLENEELQKEKIKDLLLNIEKLNFDIEDILLKHKNELKQKAETLEERERECKELEEEKDKMINNLKMDLNNLNGDIESNCIKHKEELENKNNILQQKENKCQELYGVINKLNEDNYTIMEEIDTLNVSIKTSKEHIELKENMDEQEGYFKAEVKELQEYLASTEFRSAVNVEKISNLMKQRHATEQRLGNMEHALDEKTDECTVTSERLDHVYVQLEKEEKIVLQLKEHVDSLQQKLTDLFKVKTEQEDVIHMLTKEANVLKTMLEGMQLNLNETVEIGNDEIKRLNHVKNQFEQDSTANKCCLEQQISQLEVEITSHKDKCQNQLEHIEKLTYDIVQMEACLNGKNELEQELNKKILTANEQCEQMAGCNNEYHQIIVDLQNQLSNITSKRVLLEKELVEREHTIEQLKNVITSKEDQLSDIKDVYQQREVLSEKLEERCIAAEDRLSEQLSQHSNCLSVIEDIKDLIKKQVSNNYSMIEDKERIPPNDSIMHNSLITEEILEVKSHLMDMNGMLVVERTLYCEREHQLSEALAINRVLEKVVAKSEKTCMEYQEEIEGLRVKLFRSSALDDELVSLKGKYEAIMLEQKTKQVQMSELLTENESIKQEYDVLNQQTNDMSIMYKDLERQLGYLEKQSNGVAVVVGSPRSAFSKQSSIEIPDDTDGENNLKKQLHSVTNENRQLKERMTILNIRLDKLQKKHSYTEHIDRGAYFVPIDKLKSVSNSSVDSFNSEEPNGTTDWIKVADKLAIERDRYKAELKSVNLELFHMEGANPDVAMYRRKLQELNSTLQVTWLENERMKGVISELADDVKISLLEKKQISQDCDRFEATTILYKDKCDELTAELEKLKPLITDDLAHATQQLDILKEESNAEINQLTSQLEQSEKKIDNILEDKQIMKVELHKKCDDVNSGKDIVELQLKDTERQYHDMVDKMALLMKERDDIIEQNILELADLKDRYTERAQELQEESHRYKNALEASPVANLQEELRNTKYKLESVHCENKRINNIIDQLQSDNTLLHVEKVSVLTKLEAMAKENADMNRLLANQEVDLVLEEEQHETQSVEVEALSQENQNLIKQTCVLEIELAAMTNTLTEYKEMSADENTREVAELLQRINQLETIHDAELDNLKKRLSDTNVLSEINLRYIIDTT